MPTLRRTKREFDFIPETLLTKIFHQSTCFFGDTDETIDFGRWLRAAEGRIFSKERAKMFGLIVKFIATPGNRDALIETLGNGFQDMQGCHSYILAQDPEDETGVWATEIWESHEAHRLAMAEPDIKAVIADAKARNLTSGRELRVVTGPIAGQGLFRDNAWRPEPEAKA